jgi:hypothetical protein
MGSIRPEEHVSVDNVIAIAVAVVVDRSGRFRCDRDDLGWCSVVRRLVDCWLGAIAC